VADIVKSEWKEGASKFNNHYYWAAWSVMPVSVILNRRALFDWSVSVYRTFTTQVDADGYLPLELARNTRALGYHNYALPPLVMIAAFGKANGLDLASEGNHALTRLVERDLQGLASPAMFEAKTGYKQNLEGLDEESSKLSWLEPYCWTVNCTAQEQQKLAAIRPAGNYRTGGNLTAIFAAEAHADLSRDDLMKGK
jgi:poly(beta-D-mannuronate) lyase